MPTYEYACRACGEHHEVVQSFGDDALTVCPSCSGELRKVFSAVGVVFKGSGFYKTDSRQAAKASNGKEKSGADKSSSSDPTTSSDGAASSGSSGSDSSGPSASSGSTDKSKPSKKDSSPTKAPSGSAAAAS